MNARIIYLGDETTAAGWRLAGVDARVPREGDEADALSQATAGAALVLVGAGLAARIDAPRIERALAAVTPLTLVVPDLTEAARPDIAARLRALLGLEAT